MRIEQVLADSAATEALGGVLARVLAGGGVVYLRGDLGAGKTTLVRGLLRALGVAGAVRSPTYTLLEIYELSGRPPILHMDLYRLHDPEELVAIGVRDFSPERSLWLVEWPERGEGFLPAPNVCVELSDAGHGRRACLQSDDAGLMAELCAQLGTSAPADSSPS